MALTTDEKAKVIRWYSKKVYVEGDKTADIDKDTIDTAVGEMDAWFDANVAALNAALSNPYKSLATAGEKATMLGAIIFVREGVF